MNKKEAGKLRAGFIMIGGFVSASNIHSKWGVGIVLSLTLGFAFITILWLGVVLTIKNAFGK